MTKHEAEYLGLIMQPQQIKDLLVRNGIDAVRAVANLPHDASIEDRKKAIAEAPSAWMTISDAGELVDQLVEEARGMVSIRDIHAPGRPDRRVQVDSRRRVFSSPLKPTDLTTISDFIKDYTPPEFIVDGVIRRGNFYTLTAKTGTGKTAILLMLSMTVASSALNLGSREVEHGTVLYMAGENPDDVRGRAMVQLRQMGLTADEVRLVVIPRTFSIREDFNTLLDAMAKLDDVKLVIVDTYAAFFDGSDDNNNTEALSFASVLRDLANAGHKPTIIMASHPTKTAATLEPRGGSSVLNEVDGGLTLQRDGETVKLHWEGKLRGVPFDPIHFRIETVSDPTHVDSKGRIIPVAVAKLVSEDRVIAERSTLGDQCDVLLVDIGLHPTNGSRARELRIASEYGVTMSKSTISRVMAKLKDDGLIEFVNPAKGAYTLTAKGGRAFKVLGQVYIKKGGDA